MSTPETRLLAINLVSHDNTVNSFNRNIIQICLYLEGIGFFAKVGIIDTVKSIYNFRQVMCQLVYLDVACTEAISCKDLFFS